MNDLVSTLSESEYNNLVSDLVSLVKSKTNKEVSTIDKVKFNRLMGSISYVVSYYLKDYSVSEKLNIITSRGINSVYSDGLKSIGEELSKLKLYYNTVFLKNMVSVDNYFYNSTLLDGLKAFFKYYDYYNNARDYVITCDYECFNYRPKSDGIEFIKDYMKEINYENMIVNKLDKNIVDNLVKSNSYVNIFEIVVNASIYRLIGDIDYNKSICFDEVYDYFVSLLDISEELKTFLCSKKSFFVKNLEYLYKEKRLNTLVELDKVINYKTSYSFMDMISDENISETEVMSLFSKLNVVELMVVRKYGSDYYKELLNSYMYSLDKSVRDFIINNYIYVEVCYEE